MAHTKAQQRLHKHHTWLIISSVLLIIFVGILALKFMYTKIEWRENTVKLQ